VASDRRPSEGMLGRRETISTTVSPGEFPWAHSNGAEMDHPDRTGSRRSGPEPQRGSMAASVIVLHPELYNRDLLFHLRAIVGPTADLIAVEQAGSARQFLPGARTVQVPTSAGAGLRLQRAIDVATFDAFFVLGRGAVPVDRSCFKAAARLTRAPKCGVVGARVISPLSPEHHLVTEGWALDSIRGRGPRDGKDDTSGSPTGAPPRPATRDVTAVPIEFWLLGRNTWDMIGPFDSALPDPWAEADWCLRVWKAGLNVSVCRDIEVIASDVPSVGRLEPAFERRWIDRLGFDPLQGSATAEPNEPSPARRELRLSQRNAPSLRAARRPFSPRVRRIHDASSPLGI
jgi:hypothetical protein